MTDTNDKQPVASCLICGVMGPLVTWGVGSMFGVCQECRQARAALAEKDAQIAALQQQQKELQVIVDELVRGQPDLGDLGGSRTQDPRYKHILSSDYYMPGHKNETKESRDPMTKPDPIIDVQTTLDDWLASNPEAQKYVRKIYYVPDGAEIPRDVTHMNRLTSIDYPDLELRLGVVATLETAALANLILGMIERSAPDPKA